MFGDGTSIIFNCLQMNYSIITNLFFLKHYKNAIQNANRTAIELECSFKCVFGRSTLNFEGTLLLSGGIKLRGMAK